MASQGCASEAMDESCRPEVSTIHKRGPMQVWEARDGPQVDHRSFRQALKARGGLWGLEVFLGQYYWAFGVTIGFQGQQLGLGATIGTLRI